MNYKSFVYFDIETAGRYPDLKTFYDNDKRGYELFLSKIEKRGWLGEPEKIYRQKSPLMPEFGRIVCATFAMIIDEKPVIKSYYDSSEKELITKVKNGLDKVKLLKPLCGFYIKGFDIPFLSKSILKQGLKIPPILRTFNIKPWEMMVVDLFDVWKSNGTLENVTFDDMLYTLGVDSPKDDISGKDVHKVYWDQKNINKIVKYCEKDVIGCVSAAEKIIPLIS